MLEWCFPIFGWKTWGSIPEISMVSDRKYSAEGDSQYSQIFILKKIHLDFQDSRQMVLTDEKWLLFVIEQVLSNALKYTDTSDASPLAKRQASRGRFPSI